MTVPIDQLLGERVSFKNDPDHAECWHQRVGLKAGVVVKIGQTIAQKAALLGDQFELPEALRGPEMPESPRVWVRADPGPLFPRGCEAAVELGCIEVLDV